MTMPLVIAVPSKGRLQENANAFFRRAGLPIIKAGGTRTYTGAIKGFDNIEIAFLSASEISRQLADGKVHMGITGEDLLRENIADADDCVELVAPLGFGYANVIVAVPQAWIDVSTMADLDDVSGNIYARQSRRMRVATKYHNLTRGFFDSQGIVDYKIVDSLGATEGAPAAGTAEIIVDITTTGSTLAANALKILDDGIILKSQANLAVSLTANWSDPVQNALRQVLERVAADAAAQNIREIRFFDQGSKCGEEAVIRFECSAPFGFSSDSGLTTLHCPENRLYDLTSWLRNQDIGTISVAHLEYVFEAQNQLFDRVAQRMGW